MDKHRVTLKTSSSTASYQTSKSQSLNSICHCVCQHVYYKTTSIEVKIGMLRL